MTGVLIADRRGTAGARRRLDSKRKIIAKIDFAHMFIDKNLLGRPLGDDAPLIDDIRPVTNAERLAHVVIRNEDTDAEFAQMLDYPLTLAVALRWMRIFKPRYRIFMRLVMSSGFLPSHRHQWSRAVTRFVTLLMHLGATRIRIYHRTEIGRAHV